MQHKTKPNRDKEMAQRIAQAVKEHGGQTFHVGGMVRDELLGRENKDIDIEIHGIEFATLKDILTNLGSLDERKVGDHFGILALKGYDLDIAMPRSEAPSGEGGHKDFIIETDPFIGLENACKRRDFTINAMMKDVLTGEIHDYFGGLEDLKNGIIRHVDDKTFGDDPLRVLRAAQFAARFDFQIADNTVELAKTMDLTKLSRERIMGELDKALLKSDKPSVFFDELRKMDHLSYWFPEVEAMIGVQQDPSHHPEGDVYTHSRMVLDQAAKARHEASNPRYFMVAALCHDFGKPESTGFNEAKGKWQSLGHDKAGVDVARTFVNRVYHENHVTSYVANMTALHMKPMHLLNNSSSDKKYRALYDRSICPEDLILLTRCDHLGRGDAPPFDKSEQKLRAQLDDYYQVMSRPYVRGEDLLKLGYEQGPQFKEILTYAHKCRLSAVDKDKTLLHILGQFHDPNVDVASRKAELNAIMRCMTNAANLPDSQPNNESNFDMSTA